jgi:hypothetical protein
MRLMIQTDPGSRTWYPAYSKIIMFYKSHVNRNICFFRISVLCRFRALAVDPHGNTPAHHRRCAKANSPPSSNILRSSILPLKYPARMTPSYQDPAVLSGRDEQNVFIGITSALISLAFSGAVLYFSTLRENPLFWMNAGGYSVELRELVQGGFYICTLGAIATLMPSVICILESRCHWRLWMLHLSMIFLSGAVLITSGIIVVSNNLVNLWEGKPLHYHPSVAQ